MWNVPLSRLKPLPLARHSASILPAGPIDPQRIARAGLRADPATIPRQWQRHLLAVLAYPADVSGGHADHECIRLDFLIDARGL